MIITLLGYMASGKSTIGRELSEKLQYKFIDLDDFISEKEGQTIQDIFKNKGEIYFRKQEHHYLKEILDTHDDIVLSLGGGTPCYAQNMEVLNSNSKVQSFYLKASLNTIVKRLWQERAKRPLVAHIQDKEQLLEFIGKHLFERAPYYEQAAFKIAIDDLKSSAIVEAIVAQLF
jgi:shikimate kinase